MTAVVRLHIVHIVYSFSEGGLENVIVQLVNKLSTGQFEHTLISLTDISKFKNRIYQNNIRYIELKKKPGHAIPLYPKIYKILRQLKPDVVHSCNFAALEIVPLCWMARVPLIIHAEHGWDTHDPKGEVRKYQYIRRIYAPFVNKYISVSKDIDFYLKNKIKLPARKREIIVNGVDTEKFKPRKGSKPFLKDCPYNFNDYWVVGSVGRLQKVKNQTLLAHAFVKILDSDPEMRKKMRLIIIGEGPLKSEIEAILIGADCQDAAWIPGARSDIPEIMQNFDCFVLPSRSEGTSCTLQEAMSSGLPVIATDVGGSGDLIGYDGIAGKTVLSENTDELANSIKFIFNNKDKSLQMGEKARNRIIDKYSIQKMIFEYKKIFTQ